MLSLFPRSPGVRLLREKGLVGIVGQDRAESLGKPLGQWLLRDAAPDACLTVGGVDWED